MMINRRPEKQYHHRLLLELLCIIACVGYLLSTPMSASGQGRIDDENLKWYSFSEAARLATVNHKKILLFMEADWCSVCKRMKREVFAARTIQTFLEKHFYYVRINIDSGKKMVFQGRAVTQRSFSKKMKMQATPTVIFLDQNKSIIGSKAGFMNRSVFLKLLRYIQTEAYLNLSYEEY
ncbi:thioredoxin family protein [Fodinibius sediminis]|uniref:Thioredoxin-related protein n=1 Tax=Fodinibius sediminis TaxID=1214077 RepID=A0A521CBP5_9BACT|nr:thioredoxin fold domain-containing protein [Fodinibius sediminis]SMO56785.1 Thioredoxin-related protein [Fodinibius sediminis]